MRKPEEIAQIIEENITIPNRTFLKNIGLPGATIANMKSGSMPSADKLAIIADGIGMSMDSLIGREPAKIIKKIGDNTFTAYITTGIQEAPRINAQSFSQDKYSVITIEPKTIEKWATDISKLSKENRDRLQDYLEILLKSQDQDGQAKK